MEKYTRIVPVGLKGNEINERMKELMGITSINENKGNSGIELTKIGPDGKAYAIVRENHEYYIKISDKVKNLCESDFKYIGGLMNKKTEAYSSYSKAIKRLNIKFNSLAESLDSGHNINVFENDNLLKENGFAGGFANHPKGGGFSGEGNLEGNVPMNYEETELTEESSKTKNNPWAICTASVGREDKEKYESCVKDVKKEKGIDETIQENEYNEDDVELTEVEKVVDDMGKEKIEEKEEENVVNEHKLSIARALQQMDAIIDTLSEGKVKKKVYTIK